jgi:hypothetical protein
MLIDNDNVLQVDEITRMLMEVISNGNSNQRKIQTGIYQINHFNADHFLDSSDWINNPVLGNITHYGKNNEHSFGDFNCYGVCDSFEQVLEKCPEIVESNRQFIITLTPIVKSQQPSEGGWRWHKWGEYIGTFESQCEYIYDEVGIEKVFVFHIYEKTN